MVIHWILSFSAILHLEYLHDLNKNIGLLNQFKELCPSLYLNQFCELFHQRQRVHCTCFFTDNFIFQSHHPSSDPPQVKAKPQVHNKTISPKTSPQTTTTTIVEKTTTTSSPGPKQVTVNSVQVMIILMSEKLLIFQDVLVGPFSDLINMFRNLL